MLCIEVHTGDALLAYFFRPLIHFHVWMEYTLQFSFCDTTLVVSVGPTYVFLPQRADRLRHTNRQQVCYHGFTECGAAIGQEIEYFFRSLNIGYETIRVRSRFGKTVSYLLLRLDLIYRNAEGRSISLSYTLIINVRHCQIAMTLNLSVDGIDGNVIG